MSDLFRYCSLILIYIIMPAIMTLFYTAGRNKCTKDYICRTYLTHFICILILPVALEMLGNFELKTFILDIEIPKVTNDGKITNISEIKKKFSESVYAILRLIGYSAIFSLGGYSFISKIYKAVTGDDLSELEEKVREVSKEVLIMKETEKELIINEAVNKKKQLIDSNHVNYFELLKIVNNSPVYEYELNEKLTKKQQEYIKELIDMRAIILSEDPRPGCNSYHIQCFYFKLVT